MANANSQFGGFLTNVGVAKQTNANALQIPWKITRMQLGDGGGEPTQAPDPVPRPDQTALIRVVHDAPLNALYPSPDDPGVLIAELVLPPNIGGFWIRETALRDADGDLIAVAAPAPSYKPQLNQGSGRTQTIRMHVVFGNTANVQLKVDPSIVLATREYVDSRDAKRQPLSPVLTDIANRGVQHDQGDSTPGRLLAVGAGGLLGQAMIDSHISGYPERIEQSVTQVYRRDAVDGEVAAFAASWHFAAANTWGRLRVLHDAKRAWVQGGWIGEQGTAWTAELLHSGNTTPYARTLLEAVDNVAALQALGAEQRYQARGAITTLAASTTLTANHEGVVFADASAGALTLTLPRSNVQQGIRELVLRRTDATNHPLVVACAADDSLMLAGTAQPSTELIFAGDWLRLRSDAAGRWWLVGQAQLPGALESGLQVFGAPGSFDWEVPAVLRSGRRLPTVTVVGAGGGCAAFGSTYSRGAGGGGAAVRHLSLAGVATVPITVGLGSAGLTGESSSFGEFVSATGGGHGLQGPGAFSPGGHGIGGDLNMIGANGGGPDGQYSGEGGASPLAPGVPRSGSGLSGLWPGGGAGAGATAQRGGHGMVKVEW